MRAIPERKQQWIWAFGSTNPGNAQGVVVVEKNNLKHFVGCWMSRKLVKHL
jgi:hypothetical protein